MTRVTTDVDAVNELFTSGVVTVFGDLFALVGIMIVMLGLSWRLALVTFAVIPLFFLLTNWFRKGARASFRETRRWVARINAFLQENLTGMAVVQLFRREQRNREAFAVINRAHADANMRAIFYYAVFYPAIDLLAALAMALILIRGGGLVLGGGLTIGVLVAFIQYSERFWRPISDLSEKFNVLQAAMAASERIFGLLDTPALVASPAVPQRPAKVEGRVRFENVWFSYAGAGSVAADADLRGASCGAAPPRRKLDAARDRLRGRAGPQRRPRGRDRRGQDLGDQPADALLRRAAGQGEPRRDRRARLGPAGAALGDGARAAGRASVQRHDRLQHPPRLRRSRSSACAPRPQAVHAHRFIEALPEGYDTEVRERGASLSVGQKQLLSFARALAHDPRVLILDEATSSVDTETEQLIQDALRVLLAGRTAIVIAHRLSTVQHVDEILVLHKGRIRERGTHQELLARRGIYWTLYQLQYKEQESGSASRRHDGVRALLAG